MSLTLAPSCMMGGQVLASSSLLPFPQAMVGHQHAEINAFAFGTYYLATLLNVVYVVCNAKYIALADEQMLIWIARFTCGLNPVNTSTMLRMKKSACVLNFRS